MEQPVGTVVGIAIDHEGRARAVELRLDGGEEAPACVAWAWLGQPEVEPTESEVEAEADSA